MFTRKPVFLHVGFPKTGTTSLQRSFFPACPGTRYAGKPGVDPVVRPITDLDDDAWDAQLASTFRQVAPLFAGPEKRVLISEEELSVGSYRGSANPATIGRRLHLLFPQGRVLVVVRNQLTLLCSLYGYAMTMPGVPYLSFNGWLDELRSVPSTGRGLHLFDYAELVGIYARLFGRESVEVLLYEEFAASPGTFVSNLAKILGVDEQGTALLPNCKVNVRPSLRSVQARRLTEHHPWTGRVVASLPPVARRKLAQVVRGGPALDTRLSAENEVFVRAYYAGSNRRLSELHGVDVAAQGYPV